ncbi:cation transporter [Shivajiella indica]|uniref:Cation transporter n=1 Tax=Shivajiella indica TaxID=872115 RepID=A0ABW5B5C3_9BACT
MNKSVFKVSKMDCPSEEQMIRMKLSNLKRIILLDFDIPERKLVVFHSGNSPEIFHELESLKLDTSLLYTETVDEKPTIDIQDGESKTLWAVLIINFLFFLIEIFAGLISNSMGLVADSLDMLADSLVYSMALIAVGSTASQKKKVARFAGYFQIILAVFGFIEVIRRFVGFEKMPDFLTMVYVSFAALFANVLCLYLLQKRKSKEAHMQASMIFTSNDIIINSGVIVAGFLVHWLDSSYPDLIIGGVVFILVARGAYRILQLAR